MWNREPWALESGIQLKEFGNQYEECEIHNVEFRIQDYLGISLVGIE